MDTINKEKKYYQLPTKSVSSALSINTFFDAFPYQLLGGGYSSDMQMAVMPCINLDSINFQGNSSYSGFSSSYDFNQLLDELLLNTAEHPSNLWIFASNSEAVYARYANDTIYTISYHFASTVSLPQRVLVLTGNGTAALNSFGLGAYNQGADIFRAVCGDEVVVKETPGAKLFLTMKMTFDKLADKNLFSSQLPATFTDINTGYKTIATLLQSHAANGNLQLISYQYGGDATQLSKILALNANGKGYALTTCSFDQITDCQGTVQAILGYAENYFPYQVSFSGETSGNAVPISFTYMNFTDLGLNVGSSVWNPAVKEELNQLVQQYLDLSAQNILVNKVMQSEIAPYIEPMTASIIANYTAAFNQNAQLITGSTNGLAGCYTMPAMCADLLNNIQSQMISINTTEIDQILENFNQAYNLYFFGDIVFAGASSINATYQSIGSNMYHLILTTNIPKTDMCKGGGGPYTYLQNNLIIDNLEIDFEADITQLITHNFTISTRCCLMVLDEDEVLVTDDCCQPFCVTAAPLNIEFSSLILKKYTYKIPNSEVEISGLWGNSTCISTIIDIATNANGVMNSTCVLGLTEAENIIF